MNILDIYRGFLDIPAVGVIKKTRKNRTPRNLDEILHNRADECFCAIFGIRFRSQSLFCTGNIEVAKKYGSAAKIMPIGNYEVCWSSKCSDFIEIEDSCLSVEEFIIENEYQTGRINEAIESGNEIMIFCDSYEILSHEK